MKPFHIRLPATSANLGPGFDSVGLAISLYLDIKARPAQAFEIRATGRDARQVGLLEENLMLQTYRELCPSAPALALEISNGIPLGMGCGSSAAAILAGVSLANEFGDLRLQPQEILDEACRREGHPDNVAACFLGGLTVSSMKAGKVVAATLGHDLPWRLLLALPRNSLSTAAARAILPDVYSRADVVENIQATALLVAAFALDRPDLLGAATRDRVHQPFRSGLCPLFEVLLPLAGTRGVYSVTLGGAGPSVLLITDPSVPKEMMVETIRKEAVEGQPEIVEAGISTGLARSEGGHFE